MNEIEPFVEDGVLDPILYGCEKDDLLSFIKERMSDEQKQVFASHFYMSLLPDVKPFPVNGDLVMEWLGYTRKDNFKRFFMKDGPNKEPLLKENIDYIIEVLRPEDPSAKETFWFTKNALIMLSMSAGTDKGKTVRMYYAELEKIVIEYTKHQQQDYFRKQLLKFEEEKRMLMAAHEAEIESLTNKKDPRLYIFQNDITDANSPFKMGYSETMNPRTSPFRAICPNGRIVFSVEVPLNKKELEKAEKFMHILLTEAGYRLAGENFKVPLEEAKMWLLRIANSVKIAKDKDYSKLSYLMEREMQLMTGKSVSSNSKLYLDAWTQTDLPEVPAEILENATIVPEGLSEDKIKMLELFNRFIDECCQLGEDYEVSSHDISGMFRIWSQEPTYENYHQLLVYLKTRFTPTRMKVQDKNTVKNGYKGVRLVLPDYSLSITPSEPERFVYEMCERGPSHKVLQRKLFEEYEKWRKNNSLAYTKKHITEFKNHMKNPKFFCKDNVWTSDGKSMGYWGLCMKEDKDYYRHPGTNAKPVEKVEKATGAVLNSFPTIAKAAESENLAPCMMSRMVKDATVIKGSYYYRLKTV